MAVNRNYLHGGNMANSLDMKSQTIINTADPTATDEVVNRNYLESGIMANALDMNSHRLTNLAEPNASADGVTKNYTDALAGIPQLRRSARAYYSFDDGSNIYNDSIGSFDGTESGTGGSLTHSNTAKIGKSIEFTADDQYIDIGNALSNFGTGDFTVSFWFRPTEVPSGNYDVLWSTDERGDGNRTLFLFEDNQELRLFTRDNTTGNNLLSSTTLSLDTWYYITVTRSGGTGTIYINGNQDKTGNIRSGVISNGTTSYIGLDSTFTPRGFIDKFGAWSRVLSAEEIKYLYHNESGTNDFQSFGWQCGYE
eukprot:gb/GECG01016110.1/.p1 GENE.gb/GECG01016110.1/~~gb/GECG01016110.1/.p1  ORF type:complete len:310 (+),score=38.52 gb/GECG01016110.1/:1-930(+)